MNGGAFFPEETAQHQSRKRASKGKDTPPIGRLAFPGALEVAGQGFPLGVQAEVVGFEVFAHVFEGFVDRVGKLQ